MQVKKIPMRMCTGCSTMKPKSELIRVVKNKENQVSIDLNGKLQGRGAYVCKNSSCFEKAFKTRRLSRNLDIAISEEIYLKLKEEVTHE